MPTLPDPPPLDCDRGLRRQVVVQSLLSDVFHGNLRAGQRLVTQQLAELFRVSHTPIREALIELAGMGVVDLLPNRGAIVRNISAKEVDEICQVRRVLECEATRTACGRIDPHELGEIAEAIRGIEAGPGPSVKAFIRQAQAVDTRLHDSIATSCGNGILAHELGRLKILFHALRDIAWELEEARNDSARLYAEADEHRAIVTALLANNARDAVRAMAKHIRSGARYWSRVVAASRKLPQLVSPRTRTSSRSRA